MWFMTEGFFCLLPMSSWDNKVINYSKQDEVRFFKSLGTAGSNDWGLFTYYILMYSKLPWEHLIKGKTLWIGW